MRMIGTYAALAALALAASPAAAATFTLDLTGVLAGGSYDSFTSGATRYDQFYLTLSGLDASNAITVAQGDTINATVALDQPLSVPASQLFTAIGLFLTSASFPAENTATTSTTTYSAGGNPVRSGTGITTTSSQIVSEVAFTPPANTAFAFDTLQTSFTITDLATPAVLDSSSLSYTLASAAVPEPASWALLVTGFGVVGTAARRRRTVVAA